MFGQFKNEIYLVRNSRVFLKVQHIPVIEVQVFFSDQVDFILSILKNLQEGHEEHIMRSIVLAGSVNCFVEEVNPVAIFSIVQLEEFDFTGIVCRECPEIIDEATTSTRLLLSPTT